VELGHPPRVFETRAEAEGRAVMERQYKEYASFFLGWPDPGRPASTDRRRPGVEGWIHWVGVVRRYEPMVGLGAAVPAGLHLVVFHSDALFETVLPAGKTVLQAFRALRAEAERWIAVHGKPREVSYAVARDGDPEKIGRISRAHRMKRVGN
jgi:hypothetical protein